MPERQFTDAELDAALEALSDPKRFRAAEQRVAMIAPQLQHILASALRDGGWFDQAHESQLDAVTAIDDHDRRAAAVATLLAEETRMGMLVGVAVGWELARELEGDSQEEN